MRGFIIIVALAALTVSCGVDCPEGLNACGSWEGWCVDLLNDHLNCGECGNVCESGHICEEGVCRLSCQEGYAVCSGVCRDLVNDDDNCGSCGNPCGFLCRCVDGTCELDLPEGIESIEVEWVIDEISVSESISYQLDCRAVDFIEGGPEHGWQLLFECDGPGGGLEEHVLTVSATGRVSPPHFTLHEPVTLTYISEPAASWANRWFTLQDDGAYLMWGVDAEHPAPPDSTCDEWYPYLGMGVYEPVCSLVAHECGQRERQALGFSFMGRRYGIFDGTRAEIGWPRPTLEVLVDAAWTLRDSTCADMPVSWYSAVLIPHP